MKTSFLAVFIFFFPLFIKTPSRKLINVFANDYIESSINKEKLKKKTKQFKNKKIKKKARYLLKQFSLKGSHAKSVRYSNQKSLRRMYRNA